MQRRARLGGPKRARGARLTPSCGSRRQAVRERRAQEQGEEAPSGVRDGFAAATDAGNELPYRVPQGRA